MSLFQLVEQVNVPPHAPAPPQGQLPLEIHAYFHVAAEEIGQSLEMRFSLVSPNGLETFSDGVTHRVATARYRTRTMGLPFPPLLGHYDLRVDFRMAQSSTWMRDPLSWPIAFCEVQTSPQITH